VSESEPIDVRDMAIVHKTFRAGYAEAAELVRAAPTPKPDRVKFLADHIDFLLMMLHVHHASEDELLYPVLVQRAPEQAAMTEHVGHEHQLVEGSIEAAQVACAAWRRGPSTDTGEALAASLVQLNEVLQPHLDDEEREVVPLAAVTLTQQEWDAFGHHSVSQIPRNMRPTAFGMLLDPLDESERAFMKRTLPAPVRLLYPLLIDRPWRKYAATLRNGAGSAG
jgi:hemerythrin-like domain-containing protein